MEYSHRYPVYLTQGIAAELNYQTSDQTCWDFPLVGSRAGAAR